jgi:hypothetical protein
MSYRRPWGHWAGPPARQAVLVAWAASAAAGLVRVGMRVPEVVMAAPAAGLALAQEGAMPALATVRLGVATAETAVRSISRHRRLHRSALRRVTACPPIQHRTKTGTHRRYRRRRRRPCSTRMAVPT